MLRHLFENYNKYCINILSATMMPAQVLIFALCCGSENSWSAKQLAIFQALR